MVGGAGSHGVKIAVHIERLVLEGLPLTPRQGPLVQAAVERELTRLFAADHLTGEMRTGGAVPQVSGAGLELRAGTHPTGLGQAIARSVHRGLGPRWRGATEATRS